MVVPRLTRFLPWLTLGVALLAGRAFGQAAGELVGSAAASAAEESLRSRVLTHVPVVPQPPADVPVEYRDAVTACAARYRDHYVAAELVEALAEARNGILLAEQAGRPRDRAEFLKAGLYASWLMGESAAGLEYGQRILAEADDLRDDRLLSLTHRVIGSIYRQLGDRERQREHTKVALALAERAGDANLRIATLNNLGNIALDDGDLASARRIHEDVLAYREKNGQRWDAAGSLTNLADVAEKSHDLPGALALHERALAIRSELDDRRGQVRSLRQVAGILRQLGRTDEALKRLADARARADKIGGHELLGQVYSELALTHEARREFAAALGMERLAAREREALAGERARTHAAQLEAQLAIAQKEKTIATLDREKKIQDSALRAGAAELAQVRWQRFALLATLGLGGVAVAAIIAFQRVRIRSERRISAETQAARLAAEEADRVKTRFLGVASHDIRTPLGNIVTLSAHLREVPASSTTRTEVIDTITSEAQRVLNLVEDLVSTAALEVGKLELRPMPIDLTEVVEGVVRSVGWQADAKRQVLVFRPPTPGTGALIGDPGRLHQVAANLLGNAIKFTPPGKTITVTISRTEKNVVLAVRDEGPGIAAKEFERLFVPFQRLSSHPTAGESSHGLGLSIAHEIVRLHGGTIRVESQPGEGATFLVELPVQPPRAPLAG